MTKVSIELKHAQLVSTHSITVAKNIVSKTRGKKKKDIEDLRLVMQLSVEQHQLKL